MALTDPVSQGDDDTTVLKKWALAVGVDLSILLGTPDPDFVLRQVCAEYQGVEFP